LLGTAGWLDIGNSIANKSSSSKNSNKIRRAIAPLYIKLYEGNGCLEGERISGQKNVKNTRLISSMSADERSTKKEIKGKSANIPKDNKIEVIKEDI
jgi:hypothetical protein